jgi:hypothetical protein
MTRDRMLEHFFYIDQAFHHLDQMLVEAERYHKPDAEWAARHQAIRDIRRAFSAEERAWRGVNRQGANHDVSN